MPRISCPYCGAEVEILVDAGGGRIQRYIEDCEVCCRPLHLKVEWQPSGEVSVQARTEED